MHFRRKVCCLGLTAFNLNGNTVKSIFKKHLHGFSFTFWLYFSIIMNHLLHTIYAEDPNGGVFRRRGRRTRATNIRDRHVSILQEILKRAAMVSPVFKYVVFYFLLNIMHCCQWPEGLPRYLNPCTNRCSDIMFCSTLKLNSSSAWAFRFSR